MIKRTHISKAVAAALLAVSAQVAFAVDEVEPNNSLASPQAVVAGTDGRIVIQAVMGTTDATIPAIPDVDFFSFEGSEGDAVTLNIDGGMKGMGSTELQVDTNIALYKPGAAPGTWEIVVHNDISESLDAGSNVTGGERDARIDNPPYALPATGRYIVGVSSGGRILQNSGEVDPADLGRFPNGSYTLIISGVTPPSQTQYVNIDIRPGDPHEVTRLNPKQKRDIPIALLSRRAKGDLPAFNALDAKVDSITFGRSGNEKSLTRCLKEPRDVNRDGLLDLVCLFDVPSARFEEHDLNGKLKGETKNGWHFEAVGKLKVKSPDRKESDRDRPDWNHGKGHGRDDDRHDGKHNRDDDRHDGKNRR
jgi:hypothetical protein